MVTVIASKKSIKKSLISRSKRGGLSLRVGKKSELLKELDIRSEELDNEVKRGTAIVWKPGSLLK